MSKIEKIRAEIDRRYNEYSAKKKTDDFIYYSGMADALDLFEQFLDTLEEEPVGEELEKEIEKTWLEYECYNEDYDKVAEMRWNEFENVARHFAEWQKEQFEKNRLAHCDAASEEECDRETDFAMEIIEKEHRQPTFSDAINYGMRLQKEKIITLIQSRIGEILGDAQPNPILRAELRELIEKIKEDEK